MDAGGRAVVPGFVDSHAHLVFAGDRAAEFAARMAGQPYDGGRHPPRRWRPPGAASDDELRASLRRLVAEMLAQGTTTFEIKSGYGLTSVDEQRALAAREVTDGVTYLGAHVCRRRRRPGRLRIAGARRDADACAPQARWIDVFCEPGTFDPDEARRTDRRQGRGIGPRVHANQLGRAWRSAGGARRRVRGPLHVPRRRRRDALAYSGTVATLLPGVEFSTRPPYPDARRLLAAGATVAIATDCNPGSCYTSPHAAVIALAVREMRMTPAEALWAATAGGARALRRTDIGLLRPGHGPTWSSGRAVLPIWPTGLASR